MKIKFCAPISIKNIYLQNKRPAHTRVTVTKTERTNLFTLILFCAYVCTSLKTLNEKYVALNIYLLILF